MTTQTTPPSTTAAELEREHGKSEYEPLLPIEKKLIGWSLGIGLTLLVVLYLVSRAFPVQ